MSLNILLEKYDVTTAEGLQKAYNELAKEEAEVDAALAGALARSCDIEGELRTTSQAYSKLGELKIDVQTAANMVNKTAELARDVSAKVRQFDLARSRVAECQHRVHDLIDLQLCSEGVEAAIKAHDYETGAAHVARFLSMDPGSVAAARARGAADPREAMQTAAHTLRETLLLKFEEAARKEDDTAVERLFKLFPQIGRADEGVDLLAKYIAKQLERSMVTACNASAASERDAAVYADAMTRALEAAAAAVERVRRVAATGATGRLPRAMRAIQPVVCSGGRRVYGAMVAARRYDALPSALDAEPLLAELALAHSRLQLYFAFLVRKTEADAVSLSEQTQLDCRQQTLRIIHECELTRTAQDIIDHYLSLERYFLEASVSKAIRMSSPQTSATTSSLVDDVFFVARKVVRRSVATGSVDAVCAVLNDACTQLEVSACGALRRYLRSSPPDPLPLPPPASLAPVAGALDAAGLLAQRLNRDVDAQRTLFLSHMSEAETGAEWAERLAAEACAEAEPLCAGAERLGRSERSAAHSKVQSCAGGLASVAAAFRAVHEMALAGVLAALKPRVVAWAEAVAEASEGDECDAEALPAALDALYEAAREALSARAADALAAAVVGEVAARAERHLLAQRYSRAAALAVERRARRLARWAGAGGCGGGAARERCARLTQAAALLALERVGHAPDALHPAPRLPPARAKEILARRIDFKIEEIKRLKL